MTRLCASQEAQGSESGLVYKCLVAAAGDLDAGCRRELGRALHMAFFIWIPGSVLTQPCDADIARVCLAQRPNMLHQPGQVGACVAGAVSGRGAGKGKTAAGAPQPLPLLADAAAGGCLLTRGFGERRAPSS